MKLLFNLLMIVSLPVMSLAQNLVPNPQFDLGQPFVSGNGSHGPYCVSSPININDRILNWVKAKNAEAIACVGNCPSPDWVEPDCFSSPRYPIDNSNRWIHTVEAGGTYREGMRVELTELLHAGETYTLNYWITTLSANESHDFRVYLSNWAERWDSQPFWAWGRNRILVDVYTTPIDAFIEGATPSPYQPMARHWHQRRAEFTVPNDMDDLEHLILISRDDGHEFDNVILMQGGCEDELLIENTTYRGIHYPYYGTPIRAGYDVGHPGPNGPVIVEDGAVVSYYSPIEISAQVEVQPGGSLHLKNVPCECENPISSAGSGGVSCVGGAVQIGMSPIQFTNYQWTSDPTGGVAYLSDASISNPVFTPPTGGSVGFYVYTLEATNSCGESITSETIVHYSSIIDDSPVLSVAFDIGSQPISIEMTPGSFMETIVVEAYDFQETELIGTWTLHSFSDFTPGSTFNWEPSYIYPCDGYVIKVRGQNLCSSVWSANEEVSIPPLPNGGTITQISNVLCFTSSLPLNTAITLIHTGFVSYHISVISGQTGIILYTHVGPISTSPTTIWDGYTDGGNPVTDGQYIGVLELEDCDGNTQTLTDFWTVMCSSARLASPDSISESTDPAEQTFTEASPLNFNFIYQPSFQVAVINLIGGTDAALQSVELYSMDGKLLYRNEDCTTSCSIEMAGRSSGIYMVRAISNGGLAETFRFVKP